MLKVKSQKIDDAFMQHLKDPGQWMFDTISQYYENGLLSPEDFMHFKTIYFKLGPNDKQVISQFQILHNKAAEFEKNKYSKLKTKSQKLDFDSGDDFFSDGELTNEYDSFIREISSDLRQAGWYLERKRRISSYKDGALSWLNSAKVKIDNLIKDLQGSNF